MKAFGKGTGGEEMEVVDDGERWEARWRSRCIGRFYQGFEEGDEEEAWNDTKDVWEEVEGSTSVHGLGKEAKILSSSSLAGLKQ